MADAINPPLIAGLLPARGAARPARDAALALGGALALSARVQVPFYPVPMTLQTLVVLGLGAAYGARLATATVGLYLAEGLLGLPVFAGALAGGPAYMAGPTGGYLAGFLAASGLIGVLAERGWDRSWALLLAAMALGNAVIFAFGFSWLTVRVGPGKAFALRVAPFAATTVVKTLLACALVGAARGAADRLRLSRARL
jgi:biotin transport system substrate-specific component